MTPISVTTTLAATRISDGLGDGVGRPVALTVRSVHRSAINLVAPDGSLVTIADERVGGLPSGILVRPAGSDTLDLRAVGVRAGMSGTLTAASCVVGQTALVVRFADAQRWSPRIAPMDPGPWLSRGTRARDLARATCVPGGLASIPTARPVLEALAAAIEARDPARTTAAARRLIGLGPGLTPSGDDALTGVAASLHAVGHPCRGALADALDDLDSMTTTVAAAMLRHAARGDVAERTHHLLAALLAPTEAPGALDDAIRETVAWGATSGSDLLSGVLLALDAATAGWAPAVTGAARTTRVAA
jgi:hypothetical protein